LKRLILLGASEEGISAAHACGYHVIVIERPKKSISEKVTALAEAIYFADIWDTDAAHKVVEKIFSQYEDIKLILSFTELGLETAAYLSERYNLKTNPFETVRQTRNKNLMRNAFASHDDLKLQTFCGKADRLPEKISGLLPMIIKPNDGFGSQNVAYIKNQSDWEKWLRTHAQSKLEWILEPFIEGPEFSVETVSSEGTHTVLGITEKETSGMPNFIETGHIVPALLETEQKQQIEKIVKKALTVLGVQYGPGHVEVKWDVVKKRPVVIEAHTRPGGDFIPFLHFLSSGLNQYELGILSFEGKLNLDMQPQHTKFSQVKFFMLEEGRLSGLELRSSVPEPVVEWKIAYQVGEHIPGSRDSFTRGGYIIASSDSKALVAKAIDDFYSRIVWKIDKI